MEDFWALREDPNWDHFNAELDGQIFTTLKMEVTTEDGYEKVVRNHRLKAKVNPIPKAIRSMLGSDEFIVRVQGEWFRLKYEEKDAMKLTVQPPVFSDRIKITGWQWAEKVDDSNCILCTKMEISCKIPGPGIGSQVEKGTEKGMKGAYADQPRRVLEFLAQRDKEGKPYPHPFREAAAKATSDAKAASAARAAPSAPPPTTVTKALPSQVSKHETLEPSFPPFSSPLGTLEPQKRPTPPTGTAPSPAKTAAAAAVVDLSALPPRDNAMVDQLRARLVAQRAAIVKSEEELDRLLRSEEAHLAAQLQAAQSQLAELRRDVARERSNATGLQQSLDRAQAETRRERARAEALGDALATAMRHLKDPNGPELEEMVAAADAVLARYHGATSEPPSPPGKNGDGGKNGNSGKNGNGATPPPPSASMPIAGGTASQSAARLSTALPAEQLAEIMGDLYEEDADSSPDGTPSAQRQAAASEGRKPLPVKKATTAPLEGLIKQAPAVRSRQASMANDSSEGFDPLVRMLHGLDKGKYSKEVLTGHVGLAGSMLLATDQRLVYVKKGTGDVLWQVPYTSLAGASQSDTNSEVVLKLEVDPKDWEASTAPPRRSIDCLTPAVVPLVLDTVQRALDTKAAHEAANNFN